MRLPHHLHQHSSGIFYFRLIVPADLYTAVGKKVIKQSLHTKDFVTAKTWAYMLSAKHLAQFGQIRMQPKISDILAKLQGGEARTYEADIPGLGRIKADGAEDHQRLMEALRQVAIIPPAVPVPAPKHHQNKWP